MTGNAFFATDGNACNTKTCAKTGTYVHPQHGGRCKATVNASSHSVYGGQGRRRQMVVGSLR